MTGLNRRVFLKGALASSVVAVAAGAGLLRPTRVLAAEWPKDAFAAKSVADVIKSLHGGGQAASSGDVKLKAPIQAENGAVVPITVSTSLPNVQAISILVAKNATPLVANTEITGAGGFFSTRMKMAESSDVQVVVKAGGKLYTAKQMVKVTVGGCGG